MVMAKVQLSLSLLPLPLPSSHNQLSPSSLEPFLSQAIARNRPRVILFSPRTNPSLLYKLTAFSHQRTIDFAFVSTDLTRNPGNQLLLSRFGIWKSDRSLLAFKEYHEEPALTLDVRHCVCLFVCLFVTTEIFSFDLLFV